jgi:hypothetical protein
VYLPRFPFLIVVSLSLLKQLAKGDVLRGQGQFDVFGYSAETQKHKALPKGAIMHGTILIFGTDEMLVATRRMIFEQAGYTVFTADSLSNAALVLMNHQIDVLILCQTLSDDERRAVLETAHTLQPQNQMCGFELRWA